MANLFSKNRRFIFSARLVGWFIRQHLAVVAPLKTALPALFGKGFGAVVANAERLSLCPVVALIDRHIRRDGAGSIVWHGVSI